jgi:hypothetical protein
MRHEFFPQAALAGRAEITIKNPATGQHVKVKIRQRKDKRTGKPSSCYFVYIALLNDGQFGYSYAGAYFSDTKGFKLGDDWAPDSRMAIIARFVIRCIDNPAPLATAEVDNANRCCKCGTKLTHPDSIHTWLGPKCFSDLYGHRTPEKIRLYELGFL